MPPYASKDANAMVDEGPFFEIPLVYSTKHNDSMSDELTIKSGGSSVDDSVKAGSSSFLEKLINFNPCVSFTDGNCSLPNPVSAILKVRTCSECGKTCNKMGGYKKDIITEQKYANNNIDEDDRYGEQHFQSIGTKIYYHNWCAQTKRWRTDHARKYWIVMKHLSSHLRALEIEARIRRNARIHRRILLNDRVKYLKRIHTTKLEASYALAATTGVDNGEKITTSELFPKNKKSNLMKRAKQLMYMSGKRSYKSSTNNGKSCKDKSDNKKKELLQSSRQEIEEEESIIYACDEYGKNGIIVFEPYQKDRPASM